MTGAGVSSLDSNGNDLGYPELLLPEESPARKVVLSSTANLWAVEDARLKVRF
jgi:hypothetical protein